MEEKSFVHNYKRCPECLTNLPLNAKACTSCKQKVGDADKNGLAKRAINWRGYFMLLISWTALFFYVWWAFFQ